MVIPLAANSICTNPKNQTILDGKTLTLGGQSIAEGMTSSLALDPSVAVVGSR